MRNKQEATWTCLTCWEEFIGKPILCPTCGEPICESCQRREDAHVHEDS